MTRTAVHRSDDDGDGSSSPRCELAGSARLRRRDWTGPPGGKENKSPRKVNIASLMSPDRRRSGSLDPAAQGKKQSGTQLCSALALSPCGAYLIVANSQFAVTTGDAKGASVIRIEAIRDETTRTHSAWIDSRDVIMRLACPYRVTRLAMWSDDKEGGGVTIVAGAPLGKMHAWRLERHLDVSDGVDAASHEGERMPDLKYLDQTPMSDPLDALAFVGPDQIVAVTHDGLVIGKYVRTSSGLHPRCRQWIAQETKRMRDCFQLEQTIGALHAAPQDPASRFTRQCPPVTRANGRYRHA